MHINNVHERILTAEPAQVEKLIDSLSSDQDALWPWHSWPRMRFDLALSVGASGGHGPIRYVVEAYDPGHSITFRFTGPKGFDGFHQFLVSSGPEQSVILRHTIAMSTHGLALLSWPLIFRPMHDALLEDCLAQAQASLGLNPSIKPWSAWVKLLRWTLSMFPYSYGIFG
ncbi:SRPBCC family protein [bacterium]|nr:SRPBCC family protein [bacterium]